MLNIFEQRHKIYENQRRRSAVQLHRLISVFGFAAWMVFTYQCSSPKLVSVDVLDLIGNTEDVFSHYTIHLKSLWTLLHSMSCTFLKHAIFMQFFTAIFHCNFSWL